MNEQIKINWYRCKIDKKIMSELMKSSNARAYLQVIPQLILFAGTTTLGYLAYENVHATNWHWALPLLLLALFVHGTCTSFLGLGGPVHELGHKTPFKTKALNEVFLKVFSFLSWSDYVGFRVSHVKHHQVTVHKDHDGEVELPAELGWGTWKFVLARIFFDPYAIFTHLRGWVYAACGEFRDWVFPAKWMNKVIPESNTALRAEHRRWARIVVFGQLALAILFIVTGHWFLIVLFTFGVFYSGWLTTLCAAPQHFGMTPNVPDFRLCCRSYTCSWLPAFLYWNMQYHVEHHMFPAVPFYNLSKLRTAIERDLPPVTHGLWATWKQMIPIIELQRKDPTYSFVPKLPGTNGDHVSDETIEMDAAQMA
ncbi:MAG: fatty acid desaturase [Chthoniobacterales bacterium]